MSKPLPDFIYKSSVVNHQEIKQQLLDKMNLIPTNPIIGEGRIMTKIFHTDWNMPKAMHREYVPLFEKIVKEHIVELTKRLNVNGYRMLNCWFQRYGQEGNHGWHNHPSAHFANVYYVECPKGYGTKFKDFEVECQEGDILSFPAFLPHMSPVIQDNSVKTVIAFNLDFELFT